MRRLLLFLLLFTLASAAPAQMKRLLRDAAEDRMRQKDWYGAEQYYGRLYQRDSSLKVTWPYAEAARLNNNVVLAQMLYAQVISHDEGKRYPLAYYWMGHVLKAREKYTEARKMFGRFLQLELADEKYDYFQEKSKLEIEACDLAVTLRKKPLMKKLETLGGSFNTRSSEFAPVERDSVLYFSSIRVPERREFTARDPEVYGRIYSSNRRRGKWLRPKPLDTAVNVPRVHSANMAFTPDGSKMVFARCASLNASEFQCELYERTRAGDGWSRPEKLPAPLNADGFSTTQPHFGVIDSTTVLFFSSNRPGGAGGYDIWSAAMRANGSFEAPRNVGSQVNTVDDEVTPWIHPGDSSLYFSSTYHRGLGGFDIFRSRIKNGNYAAPVNVGYPINSSLNDLYFSVDLSATRAYISSNRIGSVSENRSNCCNDIYTFRIDTVKKSEPPVPVDTVKVIAQQMRQLVPLTLYFHNDEPDPRTKNTSTTKTYEQLYNAYLKMRGQYTEQYGGGLENENREQAVAEIENFFADSVESGYLDLVRFTTLLEEVLEKGETVVITMRGYCSPLASTDYNINLAKRRISSLRNFFMQTKDGVFQKYVNVPDSMAGGRIVFEEVEVGELPVSRASDNLSDKRSSVFSPHAASERKIQIIAVSVGRQ